MSISIVKKNIPDLKQHLVAQDIKIELKNTNTGIASCIRRTALDEIPTKRLKITSYETDDEFLFRQYIDNRIGQIPLSQDATLDDRFILDVENKTNGVKEVNTADITYTKDNKKRFFNDMILLNLMPLRKIKITIGVVENKGYIDSRHCGAYSSMADPVDYKNEFPSHFNIIIKTNGEEDGKNLILRCIDNIIVRLKTVVDGNYRVSSIITKKSIKTSEDPPPIHRVAIDDESHSLKTIFEHYFIKLYREWSKEYNVNVSDERRLLISLSGSEDEVGDIVKNCFEDAMRDVEKIKTSLLT